MNLQTKFSFLVVFNHVERHVVTFYQRDIFGYANLYVYLKKVGTKLIYLV